MTLLGHKVSEETDELLPISHYVKNPRGNQDFIIDVIAEVCSQCPSSKYVVSNFCRACEARPCQVNCPKNAVNFENGKAEIDEELCVNCGKCAKQCPYNAIQYQARPCEESCAVGAIYQDEDGIERIDESKCTLCGNCMQSCPFGAITPSTTLPQIISEIKAGNQIIAMVAPSIAGQFRQGLYQIYGSIISLGFAELYPVALGADLTAAHESIELQEHLVSKATTPLTSSCCPSWVKYVKTQTTLDDAIISST
ncbi:MAG: 4Fe-4S binding protein, partial [Bacteroidales bacterium]|nr:4Fe-4S binding protein [Bacteroidales bacterium]